ncbi:helix-turn-helix domain-containing protein [Paenibacillus methanolicus]|uniref:Response regulator receiver domain-containing protein n=1 Tax=Paenibacillus methanolicus TaxID=582686 RepID=A0A5S5CE69_9BACL|nr:helix-turn-helix domain-containing protein [Paenibacillus methanolicus]TYP76792.1 response regulator receiver domain-containing protein [Paenibacillus methanolicus]
MYKVLLVDPNRRSREETDQLLDWKRLGFDIRAYADDASEALALLASEQVSLVLISLKAAHADGMRTCEHIRQKSTVPIILIGGSDDFHMVRRALAFQVSDYIAEPVQAADVTASLLWVKKQLDDASPLQLSLKALPKRAPEMSIIDIVKQYVQEQLNQNITLKKISALLHFNCAYLGQKFKDHENMSFNEYLLQQRMEKAKLLLEQTDMRIYEIASEVGYTEIDWFYKKFKAYTGASANEYRKQSSITA